MSGTLNETMIDQSFRELLADLAARQPTPGGGAAAGMQVSLGVALFLMAVRFSRDKEANAAREDDLAAAEATLEALLERMQTLPERDCASFGHVADSYRLPKETPEQRDVRGRAIQEAMAGAMEIPEETLCLARDAFVAIDEVSGCIGKNIVSDLGSGAQALCAGAECAFLNVRINATYLRDRDLAHRRVDRVLVVREEILRHRDSIMGVVDGLLT